MNCPNILKEQQSFIESYQGPCNFIRRFVELYYLQKKVSIKVFPSNSKYFLKFREDLLEYCLRVTSDSFLDDTSEIFKMITPIKDDFLGFYNFVVQSFYKGLNILICQAVEDIKSYNFHNTNLLYRHTLYNINLYPILLEYSENFFYNFEKMFEIINKVCEQINVSLCTIDISPVLTEFLEDSCNDNNNQGTNSYNMNNTIFFTSESEDAFGSMIDNSFIGNKEPQKPSITTTPDTEVVVSISDAAISKSGMFVKVQLDSRICGINRIMKYSMTNFTLLLAERLKSKALKEDPINIAQKIEALALAYRIHFGSGIVVDQIKKVAESIIN